MKLHLLTIALAIILFSCGSSNDKETTHGDHDSLATKEPTAKEVIAEIKPAFTSLEPSVSRHIRDIFDHYIHVKTALVNSNSAEAKNGAEALLKVVNDFDNSLLPVNQKEAYDKNISGIKSSANKIASEPDLEKQRGHFASLSNEAYGLARSFGAGKPIYHDHCPMAFDNKGAMWLSESKAIKNPYYGEKMMECGSVEEVIE